MTQVEEIKLKTDIVALIAESVKLTKAGKHYKGLCPFHSEKTPSFTVSPELQIYKCFGCGESGDCFTFLEKFEGMEFSEALRFLANRVGVELVNESRTKFSEKDILYQINESSIAYYHYILTKHESGKDALEYVTKKRLITKDSIKTFLLGYAPQNPTALVGYLLNKKKFKRADVEKSGVAVLVRGTLMDRFRGRVIFPLFDNRGNAIGLAGRILPQNDNGRLAKYINSPETPVYHKSMALYGLNITKKFIKQDKSVVIVEGELDAISSYQAGVKNVVAIKGSALTEGQLRILSRLTDQIILALDADVAGDAAARRGIQMAQGLGFSISVLSQEKYKDPDEFAKADPEGYKSALKNAIGIWDFIINSVVSKNNIEKGEGKAKVSRELIPILSQIGDSIVQAHYAALVARTLSVPTESVLEQIQKHLAKSPIEKASQKEKLSPKMEMPLQVKKSRQELLETDLLSLALHNNPAVLINKKFEDFVFTNFGMRVIEELRRYFRTNDKWSAVLFVNNLPPVLKNGVSELLLAWVEDWTDERLSREIENIYSILTELVVKEKRLELSKLISQYEKSGDSIQMEEAQSELVKLNRRGYN